MSEETEVTIKEYHLRITGADSIGFNFIENVVAAANLGAVITKGAMPMMRFPHSLSMTLVSDTHPVPTACTRVFEAGTNKEIFAAFVEPVASEFSLDVEEVDKSTNGGVPWTKEQLLAMDFDTELRAVCKSVGITGRSKDKMIKEYLAKFE